VLERRVALLGHVRVDLPRRELDLAVTQILKRAGGKRDEQLPPPQNQANGKPSKHARAKQKGRHKRGAHPLHKSPGRPGRRR